MFGWQLHEIESICHASSPQTAAEASALDDVPSTSASFCEPAWAARRFFESGAQTTRHDTLQSTGIVQVLRIVSDTVVSFLSC